jgi:hypothetical protein
MKDSKIAPCPSAGTNAKNLLQDFFQNLKGILRIAFVKVKAIIASAKAAVTKNPKAFESE